VIALKGLKAKMLSRHATLQNLVLNAFADDFEDFEMIIHEVTQWAAEKGLTFSQDEIAEALEQSIRSGYAKAYVLSPTLPGRIADFSRENINEFYFCLTPEGLRILSTIE
jgi:hypothetical protein